MILWKIKQMHTVEPDTNNQIPSEPTVVDEETGNVKILPEKIKQKLKILVKFRNFLLELAGALIQHLNVSRKLKGMRFYWYCEQNFMVYTWFDFFYDLNFDKTSEICNQRMINEYAICVIQIFAVFVIKIIF